MLRQDCSLLLRGVQRNLRQRFRVKASRSAIGNALRQMDWTRKKLSKAPVGRNTKANIDARREYAEEVSPRLDEELIFLDECSINMHTCANYGWAPRGVRAVATVPNQRGANISVLVALSGEGQVVARAFDGAVNGIRLQTFLEQDLFGELQQWGGRNRLLIMDNAPFHHKPVCYLML